NGSPQSYQIELRLQRRGNARRLAEGPAAPCGGQYERRMSVLNPLPPEDANVIVVSMLTPSHAVDLFIGDLTRKSRSRNGRTAYSYRQVLNKFANMLEAGGRK